MRNLKKILALVLALVMTMSVMATAAFTDATAIDTSYDEAAEVLAGLKVFVGRTDGSFDPKANITRAEVAAIIYRIVTGDVNNTSVNLYTEGADFTDTKGHWAEGYIGYCNNAGFIAGYGNGKFGPNDNVTGMQAAAMVLRAVGYDAQDEFTGANWDKYVAKYAQELGLFKNLKADVNLNKAVSREVVAEILFQAIQADMVEWTPAFDYQPVTFLGAGTQSLGEKTFNLKKGARTTVDNWGRPGHIWTAYTTNTKIATIVEDAKYTSNVAVKECDIAHAVKLTADKTYDVYDNAALKTGTRLVQLLGTTAADTVGAQGQILEVYTDRIVLIDTLLAKVTAVADATYDANGHLANASKITLDVYEVDDTTANTVYATNGKTNYPYAVGDYVLVNAHLTGENVIENWLGQAEYLEILSVATAIEGTQTVIWYQADQHTVNGTTYNDAQRFHLNVGTKSTGNRTWYFDQFGNLIGNEEIKTQYGYAAVKNMWWAGDPATGLGVAKATLVYMDGTENVVTVSGIKLNVDGTAATKYAVPAYAAATSGQDMLYVEDANLYVASYAPTNAAAAQNGLTGVITTASDVAEKGHLFQVTTKADGTVLLDEVTAQVAAKILPKYAVISADLKVNSNTQFLLFNTTTKTFSAFADFNNMPSFQNTTPVIDYVKDTATGYAKYVYIIGTPDSTTTYNFVMPLSINYSAQLKDSGINYYLITITNVDGTETTLKVKEADFATILNTLVNNVNNLYYVTFTGEYATGLVKIQGISQSAATADPYKLTGLSSTQAVSTLVDDANTNKVVRTGNDLAFGEFHFNVTEATEIVGTLPEGRQTAKTVYVLHKAADNTAIKVWVVANGSTVSTSSARPVTGATLTGKTGTVANGYNAADVSYTADAVYGTSTSTATCTLKQVAVQWQKVDGNGVFQNWNGDVFQTGETYRAVVTFAIDTITVGANGEPCVATKTLTATSANYIL